MKTYTFKSYNSNFVVFKAETCLNFRFSELAAYFNLDESMEDAKETYLDILIDIEEKAISIGISGEDLFELMQEVKSWIDGNMNLRPWVDYEYWERDE